MPKTQAKPLISQAKHSRFRQIHLPIELPKTSPDFYFLLTIIQHFRLQNWLHTYYIIYSWAGGLYKAFCRAILNFSPVQFSPLLPGKSGKLRASSLQGLWEPYLWPLLHRTCRIWGPPGRSRAHSKPVPQIRDIQGPWRWSWGCTLSNWSTLCARWTPTLSHCAATKKNHRSVSLPTYFILSPTLI